MSVLNDILVQNGMHIRAIAASTSISDSKRVLKIAKRVGGVRMEKIEYSVEPGELSQPDLDLCNQHWRDDLDRVSWGLPGGSFASFVDRLLADGNNWAGDYWWPSTERYTTEEKARDALLASYLFPFLQRPEDSSPAMTHGILPALECGIDPETGSAAVTSILLHVATQTPEGMAICKLSTVSAGDKAKTFRDFSTWGSCFSIASSPSIYDAIPGTKRADNVDWARAGAGSKYLALADLCNIACAQISAASGRGRTARKYQEHQGVLHGLENALDGRHKKDARVARLYPVHDYLGKGREHSFAYRTKRTDEICMLAAPGLVLVRVIDKHFLLTVEDLKALKFVAMSHSMWHVYAASIAVEYSPAAPKLMTLLEQKHYAEPDSEGKEMLERAEQIAQHFKVAFKELLSGAKKREGNYFLQEEVSLEFCQKRLDSIWEFYISVLRTALKHGIQDYVGKYLQEIFAVFTSTLGGHLAVSAIDVQKKELVDKFSGYGFSVVQDVDVFMTCMHGLPVSAQQDFGRLAKICAPYDVNPVYSYIDRVNKMRKPSPRGVADFQSDYAFNLRPETEDELHESEIEFRCALRVLLAMSDVKSRAMKLAQDEKDADLEAASWPERLQSALHAGAVLNSAVKLLDMGFPAYDIPNAERRAARNQARELIIKGILPTNPLAGAYLDTSNIFSYLERGDPDIAILKPTSLPPSSMRMAMSNVAGRPVVTPTRDTDGNRPKGVGKMISAYLRGQFPSRVEAVQFVAQEKTIASTSDKIETNKYPLKTRVIVGLCAESRRVQGEFEFNNGKVLINVPGYIIGVDPAVVKRNVYAALRDDVTPGYTRVYGSMDISSWSAGMHWDVQKWTNEELANAYDGGGDNFAALDNATKGSLMIRAANGIRLAMCNLRGSNYEGVDGKRNTLINCTCWYISRCNALQEGVQGVMRAFLYIDDGAFVIDLPTASLEQDVGRLRHALIGTYVRYGFDLSISKTVFSTCYMQLLNEIYFHGMHIGYGFRAACHTASQTFPIAATVAEELSVIVGGIRGAAVSGGHPTRLMVAYHYILYMYIHGVIGNKGRSIKCDSGYLQALLLYLPRLAGGFGIANWLSLFSNLAGNRDVEKLYRLRSIIKAHKDIEPLRPCHELLVAHCRAELLRVHKFDKGMIPDRVTCAHPSTLVFGAGDRSAQIATAALQQATHPDARKLLEDFLRYGSKPREGSFTAGLVDSLRKIPVKLPSTFLEKALATDPDAAVTVMVEKIAGSSMIRDMLGWGKLRALNRRYLDNGRRVTNNLKTSMRMN